MPPPPAAGDERDVPAEDAILGVDYGTVRIGLALGFPGSGLVIPLPVMPHPGTEEDVIERLAQAAAGRGVTRVVIGDPLHMTGERSPMSQTVARLRDGLIALGLRAELQDERLTSADAEAQLRDAGLKWWQVDKGRVDALSAMNIVRDLLAAENPALGVTSQEPPEPPPSARERESERAQRRRSARRRGRSRRRGEEEDEDGDG